MTRYFMDAEFAEDGHTIDLISIGIVAEDGRELYLQSAEFNPKRANERVQANVLPHLELCAWANYISYNNNPAYLNDLNYHKHQNGQCIEQWRGPIHNCPWRTRRQIADAVASFCEPEAYGKPEFWGWITPYDWIAVCQLFGTMMDIPTGWPHYMRDLQFVLDTRGIADDQLPQQKDGMHNALADARHIRDLWHWLQHPLQSEE